MKRPFMIAIILGGISLLACVMVIMSNSYDDSSSCLKAERANKQTDYKQDSYLSITYTLPDPKAESGRKMVFYTYDLNNSALKEQAEIPFESQYALGCVDIKRGKVYYSAEDKEHGKFGSDVNGVDHLFEYDIKAKSAVVIEKENRAYNDIVLIDDKLLVTTIPLHAITTGMFDLNSRKFIFKSPKCRNEDGYIDYKYDTRPVKLNYNPKYKAFLNVCAVEDDLYDIGFRTGEKGIIYTINYINKDLDIITSIPFKIKDFNYEISAICQTSKNHALMLERVFSDDGSSTQLKYYDVDLSTKECKETESPFPDLVNVKNYFTVDGGKTFFIIGGKSGGEQGLLKYDSQSKKYETILKDTDTSHVVNCCCVSSAGV